MYYEINVSKNGKHLFATHERSLTNTDSAMMVLRIILNKFPESEGYKVLITKEEKRGEFISVSEFLEGKIVPSWP